MKRLVLMCGILTSGIVFMFMDAQANDADRFDEIVRQIQEKEKQKQEQERRKMGGMTWEEFEKMVLDCIGSEKIKIEEMDVKDIPLKDVFERWFEIADKNACQKAISAVLEKKGQGAILEQCDEKVCATMGILYFLSERFKEAIPYFEKASALGDNVWYGMLGVTYDKLQDYYNAKKYVEIGCNKGNGDKSQSESCHHLGVMYYEGRGVRQNYHKAHEFYDKACNFRTFAPAYNDLGVLYDKGQGVRQNRSTAKQYYGKACDLGYQPGCDNYKLLHNQGVE